MSATRGASERDVRLLEFHARVTGPPSILRHLDAILPLALEWSIPTPTTSITRFDVSSERPGTYSVTRDRVPIWHTGKQDDVIPYLEWTLNAAAIEQLQAYYLAHAGAVADGDRGILLPAACERGKTTLVAALVNRGFQYFSDEVGVLDLARQRLLPFAKSLHVREGSRAVLSPFFPQLRSARSYRRFDATPVWYLQPRADWLPRAPVRLSYVILPEYRRGATTAIVPIPRSDALQCFVKQSFNLHQHGVSGIEKLVRMLRDTECYRLTFGDAHEAAAAIAALIASPFAHTTPEGGGDDGIEPRRTRWTV